MPTANEMLFDLEVHHAIALERLKTGTAHQAVGYLNGIDVALREHLLAGLGTIAERGADLSRATERRLAKIGGGVAKIRGEAFGALEDDLVGALGDVAVYEAEFQKEAIERVVPVKMDLSLPSKAALAGALLLPFRGKKLKEWTGNLKQVDTDLIKAEIRIGLSDGNTTDQLVRRVMGTRASRFRDGAINKTRHNLEAIVRTAVKHVTQTAKETFWKVNPAIKRVRYTAILDGRTTFRCLSLDGKIYPVGVGPRPPQHFRCRSDMYPVLDGMEIVGDRTYVVDTRTPGQLRVDFRRLARSEAGDSVWRHMGPISRRRAIQRQRSRWATQNIGRVPAKTTYAEWFSQQSAAFQDDMLGPARGRLYRQGELKLDRFVDHRGKPYTLDTLKKREKEAFEQASAANRAA